MRRSLLVCIAGYAFALGACSSHTSDTPPAMMTDPTASWSRGVGGPTGESSSTLDFMGASHPFVVHAPPAYDPAQGTTLLLHFHGLADSLPFDVAQHMDDLWADTADQNGFILAGLESPPCPTSPADTNPQGCWFPDRDAPLVDAFLAQLESQYNIDKSRVFVSGHSNGAFFVDSLGLMRSSVFAAAVEFDGGCSDEDGQYLSCTTVAKLADTATRKIPYFTVHHPDDQNVPSTWTDGFAWLLDTRGFPRQWLMSYDGLDFGGHNHTPDPAVAPPVWSWLSTFSLDAD